MAAFMNSGMRFITKSNIGGLKKLVRHTSFKVSNVEPPSDLAVCSRVVINPIPTCKFMSTGFRSHCGEGNILTDKMKIMFASDLEYKLIRKKSDSIPRSNAPPVEGDTLSAHPVTEEEVVSPQVQQSNEENEEEKKEETKKEKKWYQTKTATAVMVLVCTTSAGGLLNILYIQGEPEEDEAGNIITDEFSDSPYTGNFRRTIKRYMNPSRKQLLPDPLQPPYYQPPYTLVIEITGVLIHPEWTYETGWRFKKRAGVDYFFSKVCPPLFEVVIFTSEGGMNADPLVNNLDPHGAVMYRLYRDSTNYVNGHHVKDLSYLNRDLSKVIIVDWNEKSFQFNLRNGLKIKKWSGDSEDGTLADLANFLQVVASSGVDDVRTVMEYYQQFDDPLEAFKENQKKLQDGQQRQANADMDKRSKQYGGIFGFFRR